ncbi:MAG: glycosyl hydrolase family 57 [Candidatus Omnitrophica bacterium]|nr:glycosyl hydrolase family 57 [Candidatus Omnitrophota bacterium]MBU4488977.1 glycosyl hydrolase family 57 [Candidatus Omnitrophota bacterium]MCG2705136.1 glycosyl hydrolase family 57 [Candidatus Omnitrophota bacterium]
MKITDFPNICGNESKIVKAVKGGRSLYASISNIKPDKIQSGFGIALHMHQPTIPAGTNDLKHAPLISNLQHMMEHPDVGDNHNASVFLQCYSRMSDFVREFVAHHHNPRIMLDYSGNLLWGLQQMGEGGVIDNLKLVTCGKKYYRYVEWTGTMWSHATVSSTPVPDIRLHIMAWRCHFASIFGEEALSRVNGFSPPEMHLPIHPDVCFEYVKALKEAGYEWLMVQEHTIENLDGGGIRKPNFPHRLIAKNSLGEVEEITIIIKTQGSDNKLIGQMQPYYEAKTRNREDYAGRNIPPFVFQIGDGENGGVMMNEFPPMYKQVFDEAGTEGVVAMNGSEYLELIKERGAKEELFIPVQSASQHRIWEHVKDYHPGACDEAIQKVHEKDSSFNLDKGSWTNDKNWVKGYENILDPINKLSVLFHRKYDGAAVDTKDPAYARALLYLLLSETSCFRYWGQGIWTDYAKEICRRGIEALK